MKQLSINTKQARFADLIWRHEPINSSKLVALAQEKFSWKKATCYNVLRRLCDKGIFQNKNGVVTSRISRHDYYAPVCDCMRPKTKKSFPAATWWSLVGLVVIIILIVTFYCFHKPVSLPTFEDGLQLSWAKVINYRQEVPNNRVLNNQEVDELVSHLAKLKVGRKDDDFAGLTPLYTLTIFDPHLGQLAFSGFDLNGQNTALYYDNKYYRLTDRDFTQYLSDLCAKSRLKQEN